MSTMAPFIDERVIALQHRNEDVQIQKPKVGSDALPIPDQENPTQRQNLKNSVSADDHALLQAHGDAPQEHIKEHNEMDLHVENRTNVRPKEVLETSEAGHRGSLSMRQILPIKPLGITESQQRYESQSKESKENKSASISGGAHSKYNTESFSRRSRQRSRQKNRHCSRSLSVNQSSSSSRSHSRRRGRQSRQRRHYHSSSSFTSSSSSSSCGRHRNRNRNRSSSYSRSESSSRSYQQRRSRSDERRRGRDRRWRTKFRSRSRVRRSILNGNVEPDKQTRKLFLESLKELIRRRSLPCNISILNDIMRTKDRTFHVHKRGFPSFSLLCIAFEQEEILKVKKTGQTWTIRSTTMNRKNKLYGLRKQPSRKRPHSGSSSFSSRSQAHDQGVSVSRSRSQSHHRSPSNDRRSCTRSRSRSPRRRKPEGSSPQI